MPLTSIERFHLLSGSSAHPNVLFGRVTIAGALQRKPLEVAIEYVVSRHHIFNRRLADSNQKPTWTTDPGCQTSLLTWMQALDGCSSDVSFMPTATELETKLDLHSTPGTHVWYRPPSTAAHSMLFFAIRHSVTDGLGATRIISELLIAYDNLVAGRAWDDGFKQLDPARLSQRHQLGLNRWAYWKHIWKQPIALAGMAKFLLRKLSAQIDRSAAEKSISVNSIAMASVFYALSSWLRKQSDAPPEKWFRMVLPISIASKDDLRSPITNRATIVQIDRCEDQMRDVDSFLHYLDREVKIMVGWQFDKLFLLIVRLMSVSRWWLRRSAVNPRARGTIVFTNLGQAFRGVDKRSKKLARSAGEGSTQIVDFDFAGPIRSGMPLNFTIQRHQQRYRITVRFDTRVLNTDQADRFLKQVEIELNKITNVSV